MYLTRSNHSANIHHFYQLKIEQGLFGDWGLVRMWGRVGSPGRSRTDWFESEADAKDARFDLHMKKAIGGYE